ncbi:MAG TPA: oxidoreductase [Ruminococcaceae bacterium]|nr:oxidoreductase [Oscillospiraceae bacterium]
MKQTKVFITTYASDISGACSALYELGGMSVMHDASGCMSTYATHDEPRWYGSDSMVFISGLTDMEAIMGDDEKLVNEIAETAEKLSPKFISIDGSPIPMMIGTDFPAIAAEVEKKTGIPSFGLQTNGMHSYLNGINMAFKALAERFVKAPAASAKGGLTANIIGLTPLDFSLNGSAKSIKKWLSGNGIRVISSWAMGSSLNDIVRSAQASVNLVISYGGIAAAKTLKEKFGVPYVAGIPYGRHFSGKLLSDLKTASGTGKSIVSYVTGEGSKKADMAVVGEIVSAGSLAYAIYAETGRPADVICPLECSREFMPAGSIAATEEDEIAECLGHYHTVIADPLYRPVCPHGCRLVPLPHIAFSGRMFQGNIPNLTADFYSFLNKI